MTGCCGWLRRRWRWRRTFDGQTCERAWYLTTPSLSRSYAASGAVRGDALVVMHPPKRAHLCQLLRPEAVAESPVALSADAFSGWGIQDAATHNLHARAATTWVQERAVGSVVATLKKIATEATETVYLCVQRVGGAGSKCPLLQPTPAMQPP